jgi:hypothetical protein
MFAGLDYATKAIALDPGLRALTDPRQVEYNTTHYGVDYETAMREMEADARRAVELDPNDRKRAARGHGTYMSMATMPRARSKFARPWRSTPPTCGF